MTTRELLAEDRLTDAIVAQRAAVVANPIDHAAKLFLFELFVIAGRFLDANAELKTFERAVPDFADYARSLRTLLRAERRRQHGFKPTLLAEPPLHMRCRWNAVKHARLGNAAKAVKWADRAEAKTPPVRGHVNGREFEGMCDADDRFASSFEFLAMGRYHWVPFEQVKKLTFAATDGMLDTVLRPAEMELKTDAVIVRGHIPLVYPGTASASRDESFILGHDADFSDLSGLVVGIGERVMTVGVEEIPMGEIRQLEFR